MALSYFVEPLTLTLHTAAAEEANAPTANLLNDEPGMMWRSTTLSTAFVVQTAGSVDCVALLYSNLRATDTVRVRAANSAAACTSAPLYDSTATVAFSGTKANPFRTKTIFELPSVVAYTHWRFDIVGTSHPAGYIEASRVIVGKRYDTTKDMNYSCEQTVTDTGVLYSGPGFSDADEYLKLPGWKASFSYIPMTTWRDTLYPFFMRVGSSKPVMFVPEPAAPTTWQQEVVYGRLQGGPSGQCLYYDGWYSEIAITALTV